MAKRKKQKIRIYFKDGHLDEIPQRLWDDYTYERGQNQSGEGMFVVIKDGAWRYMYNMSEVCCVIVG